MTNTYYAGVYYSVVSDQEAIKLDVTPCSLCDAYQTKACGSLKCRKSDLDGHGIFYIKTGEEK